MSNEPTEKSSPVEGASDIKPVSPVKENLMTTNAIVHKRAALEAIEAIHDLLEDRYVLQSERVFADVIPAQAAWHVWIAGKEFVVILQPTDM